MPSSAYSAMSPDLDFYQDSKNKLETARPVVMMFPGPYCCHKTTTLAKLAYHLQEREVQGNGAADTFRAGAREQLEGHGRRVGFKVIGGPHDAVQHARAKGYHYVLIDTAGRMHADKT